MFSIYDKDGNGTISESEFGEVIIKLIGHSFVNHKTIKESFKKIDVDKNNEIDYEEFETGFYLAIKAIAEKTFDAFDKNNDGVINKKEFFEAFLGAIVGDTKEKKWKYLIKFFTSLSRLNIFFIKPRFSLLIIFYQFYI
ncbi:EF-hand domain-containing protein [endosymbiont GvMRE of Glomus versiforme]|uniref:EF-hand domain-containing protein n=1 Tax=endosymbiont GvMRE of Glomus versiforme TaxID=2039283 RepID=UPI0011C37082|nr:EF-hand domain-containing protein [endosymbiont GvMRE of Glomus versiforme]